MKKINNILIISESIDVNDSSGSKANVALIENLSKVGFELKVLHYTRREISLPGISCVSISEKKNTVNYILGKSLLVFQRITKVGVVQFFEKRIGFSFLFLNDSYSITKVLQKEDPANYDWVITLSKGASFRPHHAVLNSPAWHGKWLAYIHDPFPFHRYPEPYDWFMPGYKQKEQFFHKLSQKAKCVVFPSVSLQEWMEKWYPAMIGKGVVIPHQIPTTVTEKQTAPSYFLKNGFTLLHAGNLMKQRSPEALIQGFSLFLEGHPEAKPHVQLLLTGPAGYHKDYLATVKSKNSQVYISDGYVPFDEVQALQENASVNIIMESDADSSPFLPGKFPHCIKANKPILLLSPQNSESCRLLGKNYPYHTENKNPEDIAFIIAKLYKIWQTHPSEFKLNRTDLEYYFSTSYLESQFKKLSSI